MNKKELTHAISHKTRLSKDQSAKALNEILSALTAALAKGEEVKINDFGAFQVTSKGERKGRNPQTGEAITIASSKAPQFKAAKVLKDIVNQRDFIENFVSAGKVTEQEAEMLRFVVAESRKAKEASAHPDELVIVETQKIADAVGLDFREAEIIANRLISKRILNTEVYTSQIDSVFLRGNYRKYL
ncbi:HU family DNA-binding protein [Planococcus sp. APC 3906]|uniref:HU family DNA-binding protein n=1 Tax=Planococcus sp. APC 3906 TaxID=3035194 RepID=UPI0025B3A527|nr:HU family DNA-binding protein [Planococcus sp. APC 3906]MDN3449579.1 HU family DNA-binding protein [Planococcus sp. APC 3906]